MSISSFKNANEELIISALDIAILLTPVSNPMVETLEDPTTGDLITLPEHWRSVGLTEKKSGVNIGNETSSTDIESYGESEPTKKIMNKRTGSTDFVMQESNRQALELFHQADYSGIEPSEHGASCFPDRVVRRCGSTTPSCSGSTAPKVRRSTRTGCCRRCR